MYSNIISFLFGIYIGTRYDLQPYVSKFEGEFFDFLKKIEQHKKSNEDKSQEENSKSIFRKYFFKEN